MTISSVEELLSKKLSLREAQNACNKLLQADIRTADRFHHKFFYEIRPIIKIAETVKNLFDNIDIEFTSNKEQYDGGIYVNETFYKVECTRSDGNHMESLRMEHLKQYGHAKAFGDIKSEGTKHNRIIPEQQPVCVETSVIIQKTKEQIQSALSHKQKEKYKGFWLAITFDDWLLRGKEEAQLDSLCLESVNSLNVFSRIFIVGASMNYIWDSNIHLTK